MTRSKWAKMTPDQQRTKVAELCGWTNIRVKNDFPYEGGHLERRTLIGNRNGPYDGTRFLEVPDYLNDLNAMYDVEETLQGSDGLFDLFAKELGEYSIHATAAQRAEAFVMTMEGKQ